MQTNSPLMRELEKCCDAAWMLPRVIDRATDARPARCNREHVQRLECSAALEAHSPDMVLCSWMPFGTDWTPAMRACCTVRMSLHLTT